ncbi:MAG TPA: 50S ribosomal protein L11 methyltransferase [Enhygromyxa sp.]|nr:50S ribosomal protein L11 methyltransferase [Enhygromyxa sp.]
MSETDAWTTVRVTMPDVATDREALIEATDRIEGLAALLADREHVGGVEVRDPSCITEGPEFVAVERPELIAYTTPAGREVVIADARELAEQLGLRVTIEAEDHVGDEWRDAWKRHYRPLRFGAGTVALLIRPSWIERAADDPTCELVLDPGRAFGTGLHESTRLCLRALVELASQSTAEPGRVLDLGCGSGILGLAAARLWPSLLEPGRGGLSSACRAPGSAAFAAAPSPTALPRGRLILVDHDPEAVETARENAEANRMAASIEFLTLGLDGPEPPPALLELGLADLIFANIRPSILIPCAPAIVALLAPGGTLVLSGILDEEGDSVRAAYPDLELLDRPREADWCALVLRSRG